MKIKMAYLEKWEEDVYTGRYALLFSTDMELPGYQICIYYRSRYQIKFLYRDALNFGKIAA